jgi:hypothetical protein
LCLADVLPVDFFVKLPASSLLARVAPATAPAAAPLATVAIAPVRASVALLSKPLLDDLFFAGEEDFFALEALLADDEVFLAVEVLAFDADVLAPVVLAFVVDAFFVPEAFAIEVFLAVLAGFDFVLVFVVGILFSIGQKIFLMK